MPTTSASSNQHARPRPPACHNCRRSRLACDRSVPECLKCAHKWQKCLGYQRLLRWKENKTSRGPSVGRISEGAGKPSNTHDAEMEHVSLPEASRCVEHNETSDQSLSSASQQNDPRGPCVDKWLFGRLMQGYIIKALGSIDHDVPELADFSSAVRAHAVEALWHFLDDRQAWLKAPKIQFVMQNQATSLVICHPHLLHTVLAISIAHLAVLNPDSRRYWKSSMIHWQHSLRTYSASLDTNMEKQDVDALYFSSQLQGMLAFLYIRDPISGEQTQQLNWISALRGTYVLAHAPGLDRQIREGVWEKIARDCDLWHQRTSSRIQLGSQTRPSQAISSMLELYAFPDSHNLHWTKEHVHFLKMLEQCPAQASWINAFMSFFSQSPLAYVVSLESEEPTSLLLLLYWCKLFARTGQWWVKDSAECVVREIATYLSSRADDAIKSVLQAALTDVS